MKNLDINHCKLEASKHFKNTWMRKWDWDYQDLRDAIKKGEKKLIIVYYWEFETIFIITGSEG